MLLMFLIPVLLLLILEMAKLVLSLQSFAITGNSELSWTTLSIGIAFVSSVIFSFFTKKIVVAVEGTFVANTSDFSFYLT